jgi:hypothetical protein
VALGDLDGDGDLDAFIAVSTSNFPSRVWFNNGSGIFSDSGQALGPGLKSQEVELGDIDCDGDLDAFVVNSTSQGNRVYLNNGTGTFTDAGLSLGNYDSRGLELGDLDGDFSLEVFVANVGDPNRVYFNSLTCRTVPTLNKWGAFLVILLMAASTFWIMRRKKKSA